MFARKSSSHPPFGPIDLLFMALAVFPAVMLAAYRLGGDEWMTLLAVALPSAVLLTRLANPMIGFGKIGQDGKTGLMLRDVFEAEVEQIFAHTKGGDLQSACYLLEIDDADSLLDQHGRIAFDLIVERMADRITGALRPQDKVARLGDARFAICLAPMPQLDLESGIQIAGRLQAVIEEPVYVDGLTVYFSASLGFCLSSAAPDGGSSAWINAAQLALTDARQNGPSGIRAYTKDMQSRHDVSATLAQDVTRALDRGDFQAWFQPQLDADTGHVSGFEALARWRHPTHGPILPDQFLPALEAQGQLPRLTETMLRQALQALADWDKSDAQVPMVSINISQQDLANPNLSDTIAWELERFDLSPNRLCLEILETVVTNTPDDTFVRNLQRLSHLGCTIDLDDYGTGHASIAAIKRFPINRIKIDRSFVMKSDQDPEQRRLVCALLSMAEHLELDTIAEGVETVGEHAFLAQLGCGYVQGFGIARPMPFEETSGWLKQHAAKIAQPPDFNRRTG